MRIARDSSFNLVFAARATVSPSYWLIRFTSVTTGLSVYCIAQNAATSGYGISLPIAETGDTSPTATSGEVQMSPLGNWKVTIFEQTSSTNLDPANASRTVWSGMVDVTGEACTPEVNTGTECPPGGDCDPVDINYIRSNGTTGDLATVDAGDSYAVPRIAVTCNGVVVLHFWTSAQGGSFKNGDPVMYPAATYDGGGPDEAPALVLPGNRLLYVAQDGTTGQKQALNVPQYQGAGDHFFDHQAGGAQVPRIVLLHHDDAEYKYSDLARLVAGNTPADLKLAGVDIKDQDDNTVATVKDGEDYNVLVFSGINDTGPSYSNSIVDNG